MSLSDNPLIDTREVTLMGDRHVSPHASGWQITNPGHQQASEVLPTQDEAIERAREIVSREGGGELHVHGEDGQIREKRTIPGE